MSDTKREAFARAWTETDGPPEGAQTQAPPFAVGDVVTMNGSPEMTVDRVDEDGEVRVIWFDKHDILHREYLSAALLDVVLPRLAPTDVQRYPDRGR